MLDYRSFVSAMKTIMEASDKPTYVAVKPDAASRKAIAELVRVIDAGDGVRVPADELHATVLYSRAPIADPSEAVREFLPVHGRADEWALFGREGDCLVLKMSSVPLRALHAALMRYGASHDFPTYEAHVTVVTGITKAIDLPKKAPDVEITFDRFEVKHLEDE